jgi:hypothetical protein
MRIVGAVVAGLWESIRETLPSTEDEAGPFLAGMCWAFCLFFSFLILFSYLAMRAMGAR